MSTYHIRIASEAQFEINEAVAYFSSLSANLGFEFAYEFSEIAMQIEDNPYLFQEVYL